MNVRRSGLTMPVVTPRFIDNAWRRGCDFVIIDLEDSVPRHLKAHARTLVKDAIAKVSRGGAEAFVRINHDLMDEDVDDGAGMGRGMDDSGETGSSSRAGGGRGSSRGGRAASSGRGGSRSAGSSRSSSGGSRKRSAKGSRKSSGGSRSSASRKSAGGGARKASSGRSRKGASKKR